MLLGWLCFDFLPPWIGVIVDLLDQLALMVVFSGCHIFCHYIEFFQDFFHVVFWGGVSLCGKFPSCHITVRDFSYVGVFWDCASKTSSHAIFSLSFLCIFLVFFSVKYTSRNFYHMGGCFQYRWRRRCDNMPP